MNVGKPVMKTVTQYDKRVYNAIFLSERGIAESMKWVRVSDEIYKQVKREMIFKSDQGTHFFLDHLHLKFD